MPLPAFRAFRLACILASAPGFLCAAESIVPTPAPAMMVISAEKLEKLQSDALAGSADAQLELALAYDDGSAGARDPVKAAEWYGRAAEQNVGVANLRLGMLAEAGTGVNQSYAEARMRYERAIALGVGEANLRLGMLHLEGWGVPRDAKKAIALVEQAAESGYRPAQSVLSDMYVTGIGAPRDAAKAIAWAERAAQAKDPEGEIRLGFLAFKGAGLKQDVLLAREWFQLSAAKEYSSGMLAMAATFLKKGQSPEDAKLGKRWLELAVENDNAAAAFYLAAVLTGEVEGEVLPGETEERVRALLKKSRDGGEYAADELLELVEGGKSFRTAFRQAMGVPFVQRYVERFSAEREAAKRNPNADHPPLIERMTVPVYPASLRLTKTEGEVLVDFIVDATGRVRNAYVVESAHEAFSTHALLAVRQWVFVPGVRKGKRVNTHMQVPMVNTHMQVPMVFTFAEAGHGPKRARESGPAPQIDSLKK